MIKDLSLAVGTVNQKTAWSSRTNKDKALIDMILDTNFSP